MYNSPTRNNKLLHEAYLKGYRQALNETPPIPPSFTTSGQQSPAPSPYRSKAGTNNRRPYKGQGGGPIGAGRPVGGGQTKHRGGTINGVCYDVLCWSDAETGQPVCMSVPC